MPDICTSSESPNNCGHRVIEVGGLTLHMHEGEIVPLSAEEREQFLRFAIRVKGTPLAQLLHRVIHGDEATNVKIYTFFGPGVALTRSNVGATPVNLLPGANGEHIFSDFTGCTQFRLMLHAGIGSGTWGARVLRDDDEVLFTASNLGAAGERELDTDWQDLPAEFVDTGIAGLRAQIASGGGASATFRGLRLGLR